MARKSPLLRVAMLWICILLCIVPCTRCFQTAHLFGTRLPKSLVTFQSLKTIRIQYSSLDAFKPPQSIAIETDRFASLKNVLLTTGKKIFRHAFKIIPLLLIVFLVSTGKAVAAGSVNGWDLFGRVPHDDWLFSKYFFLQFSHVIFNR